MDKFSFITLWDRYRGLLTLTQQEITDLYFNRDLTLSEIADEKGITRQGVSECLKTSKKQLEEYEEKLGFCRAMEELCLIQSFTVTDAGKWAEGFKTAHPEFTEEVAKLEEILSRDYGQEIKETLSDPAKVKLLRRGAALKQGLKVD